MTQKVNLLRLCRGNICFSLKIKIDKSSLSGNALGGTNFWASGLHLYAPLPFR